MNPTPRRHGESRRESAQLVLVPAADPAAGEAELGGDVSTRTADDSAGPMRVSVWATAQRSYAAQRRGRFVPGSEAHPARMLPDIAATAIATFGEPGGLVLDPMCGIGTTLVAALEAGHPALGIEVEPRWVGLARANVEAAQDRRRAADDPVARGRVLRGDARALSALLPESCHRAVQLVVTSPPYGPSTHGYVDADRSVPVHKRDWRYGSRERGPAPANLARGGRRQLVDGFSALLDGLRPFLRPDARVVVTARPWRAQGELVDLPSLVIDAAHAAGLVPVERCVALLARISDDGELIHNSTFFQRSNVQRARAQGIPLHLIAHEDIVVLAARPLTTTALTRPDENPHRARPLGLRTPPAVA